jgi:hypothetical protein
MVYGLELEAAANLRGPAADSKTSSEGARMHSVCAAKTCASAALHSC